MNSRTTVFNLEKLKSAVDWKLLLFLLLFLNVKLAVKIPAIILIYLLQFNFRFGFKIKDSRLPLFYLLVLVIVFIDFAVNKSYTAQNYIPVLLGGACFWILSILAVHQVKLAVERNDVLVIHQTILIFFLINAAFSILNLVFIMRETGAINPYTYQGQYQKYFISTGDFIKGVTFDTSTTNAVLNAFGVIYFLFKRNAVMLLLCMAVLLLAGSNFVNLAILPILVLLFIFKTDKNQKSLVIICLLFFVVFMTKISPQNSRYVMETFRQVFHQKKIRKGQSLLPVLRITERPDSTLNPEERKQKIATLYVDSLQRILNANEIRRKAALRNKGVQITDAGRINLPKPDINSAAYQSLTTTPTGQLSLLAFIHAHKADLPLSRQKNFKPALPGKAVGLLQTVNFFKQHPAKLLTGEGIGNFSSKLAFRASGIGVTGGYPAKYIYINHDFEINHLDLYLSFFSKKADFHSLTHSPFSVYDQMLSEYGLLGLLALLVFYLGFFTGHLKQLTYGIPLLAFIAMIFFIDYWFEQLSVMVLFELMLFLNIKEAKIS